MADVLDRLEKLIALAGSPVVEEARTAALQAVNLIKKNKIQFSMPGQTEKTEKADNKRHKTSKHQDVPGPVMAISRENGFCKQCGRLYYGGETVWWSRGAVTHQVCVRYWQE